MLLPNITIGALVREIGPKITGMRIVKIQEVQSNWLKITLQGKKKREQLILGSGGFFLAEQSIPAQQHTTGFGAFLNKKVKGKKVEKIEQYGADRVIVIYLEEYLLIAELFAKGNILLVKEGLIESAYRKEAWKDRTLRKNAPYKFPHSRGMSPTEIDVALLKKMFAGSTKDAVRTLVNSVNVAPILAEEALARAGVKKSIPAAQISQQQAIKIEKSVHALYDYYNHKTARPVIIRQGERAQQGQQQPTQIILPFRLTVADNQTTIPSINSVVGRWFVPLLMAQKKEGRSTAQERRIGALKQSRERQKEMVGRLQQQVKECQKKAEAIYLNYQGIQEALKNPKEEIMYTGGLWIKSIDKKNNKIIVELPE